MKTDSTGRPLSQWEYGYEAPQAKPVKPGEYDPNGYIGDQLGWIGENWLGGAHDRAAQQADANLAGLVQDYQTQGNPYSMENPGILARLAQQRNTIDNQYQGVQDQAMRSLARRGALGTAQETSLLRQLALDHARASSGASNDMQAENYGRAQEWNDTRRSNLYQMLGGQRDYQQEAGNAPKQALAGIAATAAKIGAAALMKNPAPLMVDTASITNPTQTAHAQTYQTQPYTKTAQWTPPRGGTSYRPQTNYGGMP